MSEEKIEKLLKKLKEYPVGREVVYVPGSKTDPETLRQEMADINLKISILIREVDLIIRTVHYVADEYNDKTLQELSSVLKRNVPSA